MSPRILLALLSLTAFALAPLSQAQTAAPSEADVVAEILKTPGTEIKFYGHTFTNARHQDGGGRGPAPMNTQFPDGEDDFSRGYSTLCGAPPPAPADNADCRDNLGDNELYWYSTAGFVQVKNSDEWGGDYEKFHNERGLTKDVYLDTAQTPRVVFYMSADWFGWPVLACEYVCFNWDPGYFPGWTVEATVYHVPLGDLHSSASEMPDMSALYTGAEPSVPIAHGVSASVDMLSFDYATPAGGGQTVYEFPFELQWDPAFDGRIPHTDNIAVKWEWYQKDGENEYILGTATGLSWNINSGEDYPAHLVLPVRNPIDVELVYPQFIHDKLVILSTINTPWGSYDIDPKAIELVIKDASGVEVEPTTIGRVVEQSVAHTGHYQPIKPTWVWDYQADGLKPGEYTATVQVTNFQHSVTTATTAKFTVTAEGGGATEAGQRGIQTLQGNIHAGHEGTDADPNAAGNTTTTSGPSTTTQKSPGLSLPLLAAGAVVAAIAARRRWA